MSCDSFQSRHANAVVDLTLDEEGPSLTGKRNCRSPTPKVSPSECLDDIPRRTNKRPSVSKDGLFANRIAYFHLTGPNKVREKVLRKRWEEKGGKVVERLHNSATFIFTDVSPNVLKKLLSTDSLPSAACLLDPNWISQCILAGEILDFGEFVRLDPKSGHSSNSLRNGESDHSDATELAVSDEENSKDVTGRNSEQSDQNYDLDKLIQQMRTSAHSESSPALTDMDADSQVSEYGDYPSQLTQEEGVDTAGTIENQDKFLCMRTGQRAELEETNKNAHITELLDLVMQRHDSEGEHFRVLSYRKAIQTIKKFPTRITSGAEARKKFGIGGKIADKIDEILETGRLRKAEVVPEMLPVLKLFQGIHGCGVNIARRWYAKGCRTLQDVREKVSLTHDQKLSLEHYEDTQEKMPRAEAAAIGAIVIGECHAIDPLFECVILGSFRRGRPMCGDVDVLVTHPDNASHNNILGPLVKRLLDCGLIIGSFHNQNMANRLEAATSWMGLCRLPNGKTRRLDLWVAPYSEKGAALLHYTGSDIFNRSLRRLAQLKGMRLSQHGLFNNVMRGRGGLKISDGRRIAGSTEEEVLAALGVPYRTPMERDC
ncbi:hypothetical protein DFS34DRAFT_63804 [Phlyctochytrium arcticum]|nr:hypothetical protein DFS34DRAFT_63804 [Phlyctochytrium arcticum]